MKVESDGIDNKKLSDPNRDGRRKFGKKHNLEMTEIDQVKGKSLKMQVPDSSRCDPAPGKEYSVANTPIKLED